MKTFRVKIPFWYYEYFEIDAENKREAIRLVLEDTISYTTEEEEHQGRLESETITAEEIPSDD